MMLNWPGKVAFCVFVASKGVGAGPGTVLGPSFATKWLCLPSGELPPAPSIAYGSELSGKKKFESVGSSKNGSKRSSCTLCFPLRFISCSIPLPRVLPDIVNVGRADRFYDWGNSLWVAKQSVRDVEQEKVNEHNTIKIKGIAKKQIHTRMLYYQGQQTFLWIDLKFNLINHILVGLTQPMV